MSDFACTGDIDPWFRKKPKKHGKEWPVVEPPCFSSNVRIADTHAHVNMLDNPALSLAQAAYWNVSFVEAMTDPLSEEGVGFYDDLPEILQKSGNILKLFQKMSDLKIDGAEPLQKKSDFNLKTQFSKQKGEFGIETGDHEAAFKNMSDLKIDGAETDFQNMSDLPSVRVACGVHPHYSRNYSEPVEATLIQKLRDPRTSALGEVGLDYHYDFSPREDQIKVFERQIEISQEARLPIILHVREAFDDAFSCMRNAGFNESGVLLHCYTSDANEITRWVDEGCYIAFGGAITFKKLEEVREACKLVPLNRLLTETDSPFMAPEPFRSTECGPSHTIFTFSRMIDLLQNDVRLDVEEFATQLYENAIKLLNRPATNWQLKHSKEESLCL